VRGGRTNTSEGRDDAAPTTEEPVMRRRTAFVLTAPALGVMAALSLGAPASAASATTHADLQPVNDQDAAGEAFVNVQGNKITVTMAAQGLVPDQPHAAHIHFGDEALHECPTIADDDNEDGQISTTEGVPDYGPVVVSLTTFGPTDPGSGLDIDRFSTAPAGDLSYERGSIKVSHDVARAIETGLAVVVVHGVQYNDTEEYDAGGPSDLAASLPAEATDPAICGVLEVTASQGVR
jgi:CHRD domain